MKRALVFQHMDHDHPGRFLDFLAEDDLVIEPVRLFENQPIPALAPYDFLFVLGGKQDCWEEHVYPWLKEEKQAIREWVLARAKPYFGVCLGHQLLAAATGGDVAIAEQKEVGVCEVELTETGKAHAFMQGVPTRNTVLQWHMAEVKKVGSDTEILATSDHANVQSIAVGKHAMATQFHCEFTLQTVAGWGSMPEYIQALEGHLGSGSYPHLMAKAARLMPGMDRFTRQMYENLARASGLRK